MSTITQQISTVAPLTNESTIALKAEYAQAVPAPRSLVDLASILNAELKDEGIDSFKDIGRIQQIMSNYVADSADFKQYMHFDDNKYTRNLVDAGNGKFNLLILCWNTKQQSPIHDHSNSHCIVKVLDGELTESLFDWPEGTGSVKLRSENTHGANAVTYMHDKLGLHRMSNKSDVTRSVSLHLYSPPIACCQTFCQDTGVARSSGNCTFHSVYGHLSNLAGPIAEKLGSLSLKNAKFDEPRGPVSVKANGEGGDVTHLCSKSRATPPRFAV